MSKNETQEVKKPVAKRVYHEIDRVISEGAKPEIEMDTKQFLESIKKDKNVIPEDSKLDSKPKTSLDINAKSFVPKKKRTN